MKTGNKKRLMAAVLALAIMIPVGAAFISRLTPSADEEITQMRAIVSNATEAPGFMAVEHYEIDVAQGEEIDQQSYEAASKNLASNDGTMVNTRDWSQYSSNYSYMAMTDAERSLYARLDSVAEAYMNSNSLDGTYFSAYNLNTTYSVKYGDLELTKDRAVQLAQWFIYSNPQYWFLKPSVLSTNTVLYIGMHDIGANGNNRARITNEMFATVDQWTADASRGTTTYQKVQIVHDRLCKETTYTSSQYDQSVYSAIVDKRTVCAGYAGTMTIVLNAVGINTVTEVSSNHAWNAVQMDDGYWYGLDATWDDSLGNNKFFLVSDSNLRVLDNSNEAHIVDSYAARWIPQLSANDYVVSYYDRSGSYENDVVINVPTNVQMSYVDETTARITWNCSNRSDTHEVQIYRDSSLLGSMMVSKTSLTVNKVPSADLTVKVRSVAELDTGTYYSDWVSVNYTHVANQPAPLNEPAPVSEPRSTTVDAPANLKMTEATESYIRLGWDKVSDADKYDICIYRDANYSNLLLQSSVTGTGVKVAGMTSGKTVYVQLRAVKTVNGQEYYSGWSSCTATAGPVAAQSNEQEVAQTPVAQSKQETLGRPGNLAYTVTGTNSVRITWSSVTNAQKYELQVCNDAAYKNSVASSNVAGTSLTLNGMSAVKTYYIQVRAIGTINGQTVYSDWSQTPVTTGSAAQQPVEQPVVEAPGSFAGAAMSATETRLTWTAGKNATQYEIQVSTVQDFSKVAAQTTVSGTALKLAGISSGRTYYVRIRSIGSINGQTAYSDWVQTRIG